MPQYHYHVDAFIPPSPGCFGTDSGWDPDRCKQFTDFLNAYAAKGWKLHSCEYRSVVANAGCTKQTGTWLVCVFESVT